MADDFDSWLRQGEGTSGYARHVRSLRAELLEAQLKLARASRTVRSGKPQTHLIIGDSHSDPMVSNARYDWLGSLVADVRPDVVIDIGDWADMGSLSHYDHGKRSFEGRRYHRDIEQAVDARERFEKGIKGLRKKPRKIHTKGNHEERIDRATDENPALDGLISDKDLQVEEMGWERYPFMVPVVVDGVAYCHYHPSGVKARPIGGMNVAANMIRLGLMSCVQGHGHTFDYSERTRVDGARIFGMMVGCYFDHFMAWAGSANQMYWRGIVVLRDVADGYGQVEKIGLDAIKKKYGP